MAMARCDFGLFEQDLISNNRVKLVLKSFESTESSTFIDLEVKSSKQFVSKNIHGVTFHPKKHPSSKKYKNRKDKLISQE